LFAFCVPSDPLLNRLPCTMPLNVSRHRPQQRRIIIGAANSRIASRAEQTPYLASLVVMIDMANAEIKVFIADRAMVLLSLDQPRECRWVQAIGLDTMLSRELLATVRIVRPPRDRAALDALRV